LSRLGAHVTGTDISDVALSEARKLNDRCGTSVTFIETNTYDIGDVITEQFDLIFMSYGVTCWLPDILQLAHVVYQRLRPRGKVLIAEFHPALMMYDFVKTEISYSYNNTSVYKEEVSETYAQSQDDHVQGVEYFWQHSLEELMNSFLNVGLSLSVFREYYYSPYEIFNGNCREHDGHYVFGDLAYPVPHVYLMQFEN